MAHTYTVLLYHIVFSTSHRQTWLDSEAKSILYPYMSGVIERHKGVAIEIGGTEDHVHILARLKPVPDLAKVVKEIKGSSSHWYHEKTGDRLFAWQKGYAAFSVSCSQQNRVFKYIKNQQDHHKKITFAEEYEGLLIKHGVEYDKRYFLD